MQLAIEQAVRHLPRYHSYSLGTDPRRQAMGICRLIVRAYHDKPQQARLVLAADDLKMLLQLGKELAAFRRFNEFERIAKCARGGRLRQMGTAQKRYGRAARQPEALLVVPALRDR